MDVECEIRVMDMGLGGIVVFVGCQSLKLLILFVLAVVGLRPCCSCNALRSGFRWKSTAQRPSEADHKQHALELLTMRVKPDVE